MIRINEDYVIDNDDLCYCVKKDLHAEKKDSKTGKSVHSYKIIGYYADLEEALRGLRKLFIRISLQEEEMGLDLAVRRVLDVGKEFDEMVRGLGT